MFSFFTKKEETNPNGGIYVINDKGTYTKVDAVGLMACPREFILKNEIYSTIVHFTNTLDNDTYLDTLSNIRTILDTWVEKELSQPSEVTSVIFRELLINLNILSLPNAIEVFKGIFNQAGSHTLVRIHELDTILNITIDPKFIETVKARYVWDMCKYREYLHEPFSINSIVDFLDSYPWYYIISLMRVNVLLNDKTYNVFG